MDQLVLSKFNLYKFSLKAYKILKTRELFWSIKINNLNKHEVL